MDRGSLVTIEDLSTGQIEDVLDLAQEIEEAPDAYYGLASRCIMASLFLEPSTRTRGSFEAAMKRLGGDTITVADASSSSMEKGESLADTIRIWSGYSDLIVLRHQWEGAARLAAEYSEVPVINAGDGSHEHPTQTLLDLYTLRKEFGRLEGKKIVLCGDLRNGRTIHSLIYALLRFGAAIVFAPGEGLGLPDHVTNKIVYEYGRPLERINDPGIAALYGPGADGSGGEVVDAIYMTPSRPHSLTLFDSVGLRIGKGEPLAIYVTRRQVEREGKGGNGSGKRYPRVDHKILKRAVFSNAIVLHPLPRVDELSPSVDSDHRSKYFQQARNGVPVRMALVALLLGLKPWKRAAEHEELKARLGVSVAGPRDFGCENPDCVTQREPQNVKPGFTMFREPKVRFVCRYCDRDTFPVYFAYPRGEVYRPVAHFPRCAPEPSRFAFFLEEAAALRRGLKPSRTLAGPG